MKTSELEAEIKLLSETQAAVGRLKLDDEPKSFTLAALSKRKTALLALQTAFQQGDYIEVTPPLNGYGYVMTYYPDAHSRPKTQGHETWHTVAECALTLGKPVVVGGWREEWMAHLDRRLTQAGVAVLVED